ncbi:MAG: pseudouridine synthase [Myxococcales bacterium]
MTQQPDDLGSRPQRAQKPSRGHPPKGAPRRAVPKTPGVRLQKLIAEAGIASRRAAEELITAGRIAVNGTVVTELGSRAIPGRDVVTLDGERLSVEAPSHIYVMMHKPRGTLCSAGEAEGKDSIYRLLPPGLPRVFSVGRLDVQSEGLLLLTNDGDLSHKLLHPKSHVAKEYDVKVQGELDAKAIERLQAGIVLDGRRTLPAVIELDRRTKTNAWYRFTLMEGRNRQIRRMCDAVRVNVLRIRRVRFGPLTLGTLPIGEVRMLSDREIEALRAAVE